LKQRAGCTSTSLQNFTRQYYRIMKSYALFDSHLVTLMLYS